MNLSHFIILYRTEFSKLLRQITSSIGLGLSALFGVVGPLFVLGMNWAVVTPLSQQAQQNPDAAINVQPELLVADQAIAAAFGMRGFFFLPILLFIMGALTFASEYTNRSIREYAVRPVPRPMIIVSRWFALCTWVVLAVSITFILSAIVGMASTGPITEATEIFKNLGTALVTDLAFVTLALSAAVLTRSMAATISILVLVFVAQIMMNLGLNILTNEALQGVVLQMLPSELSFVENTFWVADYLVMIQPPLLWGSCAGSTHWAGYCTLAVGSLGWFALSLFRFQTMDLP